ncbi:MAG: hypothetical protein GY719_17755 [bacterium]|nr:hypothetical protein [bacterium]
MSASKSGDSKESAPTRQVWYKVAEIDELPENRVKPVTCGVQTICLTRYQGNYGALSNKYAKICGALGIQVTEKEQLDDAIAEALAHDGPSLVEVVADPELI